MIDFFGKGVKELQKVLESQSVELADKNLEISQLHQKVASLKDDVGFEQKIFNESQKRVKELQDKLEQVSQDLGQEQKLHSDALKANSELNSRLEIISQELQNERDNLLILKKDKEVEKNNNIEAQKNFTNIKKQSEKLTNELKQERENFSKIQSEIRQTLEKYNQLSSELKVLKQQNKLLLVSIEDIENQYGLLSASNQALSKSNNLLATKLARFTSRVPSFVDYGDIEIVEVNVVSEIPKIVWKVSDYSNAKIQLPIFYFQTVMQDGAPGIALLEGGHNSGEANNLIPKLLQTSPSDLDSFRKICASDWQKITIAVEVLEHVLKDGGHSLDGGENFDFAFWSNSLKTLVTDIRRLPNLLRFDAVKLKRELLNPDYEHLWLEIYNLNFGPYQIPKFELRIGASMITKDGFSNFPKLEIPLIDGKDKPFESWFAESRDDFGAKFEVRFSLEKNVFDLATFLKLNPLDQRFLAELIVSLPLIIGFLVDHQISIHRPWDVWQNFLSESVSVFKRIISNKSPSSREVNPPKLIKTPTVAPIQVVKATKDFPINFEGSASLPKKAKPISVSVVKRDKLNAKIGRPKKVAVK